MIAVRVVLTLPTVFLLLLSLAIPVHADDVPAPPIARGEQLADGTFQVSWLPPSGPLGPTISSYNVYRIVNGEKTQIGSTDVNTLFYGDAARPAGQLVQYVVTWVYGTEESLPSNPVDGSVWPHCTALTIEIGIPPNVVPAAECLFPLPGQ